MVPVNVIQRKCNLRFETVKAEELGKTGIWSGMGLTPMAVPVALRKLFE